MVEYKNKSVSELTSIKADLEKQYNEEKAQGHFLDMSRGKPAGSQLNLSNGILDKLETYITEEGVDARNYGILDGLKETKRFFSELLDIPAEQIIICGNSSLNLMYDAVARLCLFGSLGSEPWINFKKRKFLCPCPGYDRHFSILEEFGFEMIRIPLKDDGPDMDMIEKYAAEDENVKGFIGVPLYSNPTGTCYSAQTVERFAKMKTAAPDFKLIWDNAYGIHHIYEETPLANIFKECEKYGTQDRVLYFFSTSKITFPGSGLAIVAASKNYTAEIKKHMSRQTIGFDKITQLRTLNFFKTPEGLIEHMKKLAALLRPKFDIVLDNLNSEFSDTDLLNWSKPKGGYFISVNTMEGCAKEVVRLCKEAGLIITDAGATYPYKNDPHDSNIRIAPSYPDTDELKKAIELFCLCVKLASVNKLLAEKQ